jgi:hypothetical protein
VSSRVKQLAGVLVAAALAFGFWHFSVAPQRAEAARLAGEIAQREQEATAAQATLAGYRAAKASYGANYATLLRLGKAVPADDDTRSLLVQLDAAAKRSGVDFRTLTVETQGAVAAPVAAAPTGTSGTGATTTGTTGTAGAAASPLPPGAVAVGSAGFSAMPFTFSFRGRFDGLSTFFDRLQRFVTARNDRMTVTGRLLRIDAITLKPDALGFPRLRAEVTASSFLLPATQGLTAGGTPSGPAAQPSAAAGTTTVPAPTTTTATVTGASIR